MDLGLNDVHVLVTGASGGIGLEIVRVFVQQGARVTAQYNTNETPLHPLLTEFDNRIQALQANLTDEAAVETLFAKASRTPFGEVQVLVLNHGVWPTAFEPIRVMSLERWRNTVDVNLTSCFLTAREYFRHLGKATMEVKDKAAIVLIGSASGKIGEAGHADYASTKSAMMYGLTLSLKNEIVKIAPKGRVNSVAPGWVKTAMVEEALKDPAVVAEAVATVSLKKVAEPRDVASQVVILSSSVVSGHVTGQVLLVEGGMEGRVLNKPGDL